MPYPDGSDVHRENWRQACSRGTVVAKKVTVPASSADQSAKAHLENMQKPANTTRETQRRQTKDSEIPARMETPVLAIRFGLYRIRNGRHPLFSMIKKVLT
jgi:hypothetical protein